MQRTRAAAAAMPMGGANARRLQRRARGASGGASTPGNVTGSEWRPCVPRSDARRDARAAKAVSCSNERRPYRQRLQYAIDREEQRRSAVTAVCTSLAESKTVGPQHQQCFGPFMLLMSCSFASQCEKPALATCSYIMEQPPLLEVRLDYRVRSIQYAARTSQPCAMWPLTAATSLIGRSGLAEAVQ